MLNQIKAIFISTFLTLSFVISIFVIYSIITAGFTFQRLGIVIGSITTTAFFGGLYLFPQARTKAQPIVYNSLIGIGTLISLYGILTEPISFLSITLLSIIIGGWVLYLNWYSTFRERADNSILKIGNLIPSFDLENGQMEKINSHYFLGKPAIYLFFRGNWCPLCMAQIKEIAADYQELEKTRCSNYFDQSSIPSSHKILSQKI